MSSTWGKGNKVQIEFVKSIFCGQVVLFQDKEYMRPQGCSGTFYCVESSSGFVCDFQAYTGKRQQQDDAMEQNLGYCVGLGSTRYSIGKNHCDYEKWTWVQWWEQIGKIRESHNSNT